MKEPDILLIFGHLLGNDNVVKIVANAFSVDRVGVETEIISVTSGTVLSNSESESPMLPRTGYNTFTASDHMVIDRICVSAYLAFANTVADKSEGGLRSVPCAANITSAEKVYVAPGV